MRVRNILFAVNFIFLAVLLAYVVVKDQTDKKAFVLNQKVFSEFKGTALLEGSLKQVKSEHKQRLDSLSMLVQQSPTEEMIQLYEETSRNFALVEQEMSNKYTADIWKEINKYLSEYGKEHNYGFIFGASGDGSLMYAQDAHNITEDVILYINKKHEGE